MPRRSASSVLPAPIGPSIAMCRNCKAPDDIIANAVKMRATTMVFALAIVIGYYVIGNVHHALHTPLMSVTNAISSIIAIGALVQIAPPLEGQFADRPVAWIIGCAVVSVALVAINMFGGFAVTQRMLEMFKKKDKKAGAK